MMTFGVNCVSCYLKRKSGPKNDKRINQRPLLVDWNPKAIGRLIVRDCNDMAIRDVYRRGY